MTRAFVLDTPIDKTGSVAAQVTTSFAFNTELNEIYIASKDMSNPTTPYQENLPLILKGQEYTDFISDLNAAAPGASQALIDLTLVAIAAGTGSIQDI